MADALYRIDESAAALARAHRLLPGGCLGINFAPAPVDFVAERGEACRLFAADGRSFLDYTLGSGALILGHAHPTVVRAVSEQVRRGCSFYSQMNYPALELAERLVQIIPCAASVKFCTTGSEATLFALRLARAFTGKPVVLKFIGGFHGNHDYALVAVRPTRDRLGDAPLDSSGIPSTVGQTVLTATFNDLESVERVLRRESGRIAAVILEPMSDFAAPRLS